MLIYRVATLISFKDGLDHLEPHHLRSAVSSPKQWIFVRRARVSAFRLDFMRFSLNRSSGSITFPSLLPSLPFRHYLMLSLRLPPPLGDEYMYRRPPSEGKRLVLDFDSLY